MYSGIGNLIGLRHLFKNDISLKYEIYVKKLPDFIHTRAACSELPSNITTMDSTYRDNKIMNNTSIYSYLGIECEALWSIKE